MARKTRNFSIDLPTTQSPWRWLTRIAFVLTVAIVIARLTTTESLRDPWDASPGGTASPRAPGAATGLVFDLISLLPAILLLARRSFDSNFRLLFRWSFVLMLAVGVWCMSTTAWASDKFSAAITGSHLLAGLCLAWSAAQLVRSWTRLRIVAAVCFGLLLVLVVQSAIYVSIDVQANTDYWNQHKAEILKEHNWSTDSFSAKQFEHKLVSGELVGFFNSPNTAAAVAVMLFAVAVGLSIQKVIDGDGPEWLMLMAVATGGLIWILYQAKSKTAAATPILGVMLLLTVTAVRSKFAKHSKKIYWTGVFTFFLGVAAIIGHGVYHHGLFPGHFSNSLQFRWEYWVASAKMFARHPVLGIGWNNFGLHYLADRLPHASEEIKDPHNFLVRTFVESGLIGGLLLVGWLLRYWWEVTRPSNVSIEGKSTTPPTTIAVVVAIAVFGIGLSVIASIDFTQQPADVFLELLRRLLYLLALTLGAISGSMLNPHKRELDSRPAPWLFYCTLISVALFLIHNLIDFSLFETGPMFVFFLLVGSSIGMGTMQNGNDTEQPRRKAVTIFAFALSLIAWISIAILFVAPVIAAEDAAHDADENIRTADLANHRDLAGAQFARAADELATACKLVPYNSDYAIRLARANLMAGRPGIAESAIARAIQINPRLVDAYLLRANLELSKSAPEEAIIRYNFQNALALNPNDGGLHRQFATALEKLNRPTDAIVEYKKSLACNAALPIGEPRRLSDDDIREISRRIDK